MNNGDKVVAVLLIAWAVFAAFMIGCNYTQYKMRREAVAAKAGHYEANQETGRSEWKWGAK